MEGIDILVPQAVLESSSSSSSDASLASRVVLCKYTQLEGASNQTLISQHTHKPSTQIHDQVCFAQPPRTRLHWTIMGLRKYVICFILTPTSEVAVGGYASATT
eukprot:2285166-Rhodomonas_salina.1